MIAATVFGAALAVPAAAQIIHAVEYTDIFDNRLGTIPAIDPVGNTSTGALSYNGWEYYDAALQSNVVPVTGPNVAAFFGSGEFEAGEDVWKPRNASVISFNQQR